MQRQVQVRGVEIGSVANIDPQFPQYRGRTGAGPELNPIRRTRPNPARSLHRLLFGSVLIGPRRMRSKRSDAQKSLDAHKCINSKNMHKMIAKPKYEC